MSTAIQTIACVQSSKW